MPLVQTTPLGYGDFADAVATFPADVTPGNMLVVVGGVEAFGEPDPVLTSNQGDTFVIAPVAPTDSTAPLLARAVAVGGPTTITLSNLAFGRFYVEEWSELTYDSGAGVGAVETRGDISVSTPNSTTVADSVVFTAWNVRTGETYPTMVVPTGYTQIGRWTTDSNGQFVAGRREETTTGVKTAAWVNISEFDDHQATAIFAFSKAGEPPEGSEVVESITFSDAQSAELKIAAAQVESITFSDSQVAALRLAAAQSETITFSDAVVGLRRFTDGVVEAITFTDSVTGVQQSGSQLVESLLFSDEYVSARKAADTIVETITFTDTVDAVRKVVDTITEQITFADVVDAIYRVTAAQVESITFSDAVSATLKLIAAQDESITFTDVVTAIAPNEALVVEQIVFVDSVVASRKSVGEIIEQITFVDVVSTPGTAPVGGGWAPQLPRRKIERDRVLDDVLQAIEELSPTKSQERKAKQAVHRLRKENTVPIDEFIRKVNLEQLEDRIAEIVVAAARKTKQKKRRRDDEELMLLL